MTIGEMIAIRRDASLSQTAMAHRMGLSMRAYQDLEAREATEEISRRHENLVEHATFELAVDRLNPMLTTKKMRDLALRMVEMIRGA